MTSQIKISPSILAADFSKLGEEVISLEKAGADLIHVDVMDGHFVPNITIGPNVIKNLKKHTSLPLDVHLMISPVDNFINNFATSGSDIITVHPEATQDLEKTIKTSNPIILNVKSSIIEIIILREIKFVKLIFLIFFK